MHAQQSDQRVGTKGIHGYLHQVWQGFGGNVGALGLTGTNRVPQNGQSGGVFPPVRNIRGESRGARSRGGQMTTLETPAGTEKRR